MAGTVTIFWNYAGLLTFVSLTRQKWETHLPCRRAGPAELWPQQAGLNPGRVYHGSLILPLFARDLHCSPAVRARAGRMVLEHQGSYETQSVAVAAIAPKMGYIPERLGSGFNRRKRTAGHVMVRPAGTVTPASTVWRPPSKTNLGSPMKSRTLSTGPKQSRTASPGNGVRGTNAMKSEETERNHQSQNTSRQGTWPGKRVRGQTQGAC